MLIQRAVLLDGTPTDIRVDELIVDVGELAPHKSEQVLDAAGGTVIPGLHDHHVHLRSAAAALTSVRVGPAEFVLPLPPGATYTPGVRFAGVGVKTR